MKFKQNLSLLLWLYRGKASKDGKAPSLREVWKDYDKSKAELKIRMDKVAGMYKSGTERVKKLLV